MKVYLVWEIINDYPEAGGGEYLNEIFLDENKAKDFCKRLTEENEEEEIEYEVRSWEIEEG